MPRWSLVLVSLAACSAARIPVPKAPLVHGVLLRYRLHEGERFVTEVRTVRLGLPRVEVVTRVRTTVEPGLRLRNRVLWSRGVLDGRPVGEIDLPVPEIAPQQVTADRRQVLTLANDDEEPSGAGLPTLPAHALAVGASWQEHRAIAGNGTELWLRATLVSADGGTGVIALRGTARTALPGTERGTAQTLVTDVTGVRRVDLASGWVGRTDLDLVTKVLEETAGHETSEPVERSRIEMRVSREPPSNGVSE